MMRRVTILACLCVLPAVAGLARAAIAPATSGEAIAENAFVVPGETLERAPQPEPVPPPVAATVAPSVAPSSEPAPSSANPLWAIPLSALTATRDRPIFSASRRPPQLVVAPVAVVPAPPPPPPPAEPEKPNLVLVGTIVGDADSFGIFIDQTSRSALRLKLGEQHEGWTLRSVQKREAMLVKDQQVAVVAMPPPAKTGDAGNELSPSGPEQDVAGEPGLPIRRAR
jgi:general secretion pathway protein N